MSQPIVAVLCGGVSAERQVSLISGESLYEELREHLPCELHILDEASLPAGLSPDRHIAMPVLHGTFGEDGQLQDLLDKAGFHYAGCDADSSRTCFDKALAKDAARRADVPVAPDHVFAAEKRPTPEELVERLGSDIVLKPVGQGSSVGLMMPSGVAEVTKCLGDIRDGVWLAERRIVGREITVGLLNGKAMGLVEVIPRGGVYDYKHKYTTGLTEYRCPAQVPQTTEVTLQRAAERVFGACRCRDFARADFMLEPDGRYYFLEINTLPGLTPTSLLPKSASVAGHDFAGLVRQLVAPAIARFKEREP